MKFNKKYICKFLFVCLLGGLAIASCSKKDDGAYDYVNQVNQYDGNVYSYLKNQTQFDSLTKVINRLPVIKQLLETQPELTIFALTNGSFQTALTGLNKIRAGQNKPNLYISNLDTDQLGILLDRYIIGRKLTTDSLQYADGVSLKTAMLGYDMNAVDKTSNASGLVNGGPRSIIYSDIKNSQYTKDWVSTTTQAVNISTTNAAVHIVAASHEFGFGEFTTRMNR